MKNMKNLKKIIAVVLTMVMVLAMGSLTAFAEAVTGTITIDNAVVGESYTLYKVFDATVASDRTENATGISYSSKWLTTSNKYFAVDARGNITITDAGKNGNELSTDAIEYLKSQSAKFNKIGESVKATSNTVSWDGLEPGYYYIDTTTGSFVTVDSITPNVVVKEKNSVPSHDKKQSSSANGEFSEDDIELNIGDKVYYQVEIQTGKGTSQNITLADTMTDGLDLNAGSIVVTCGGTALVKDADYTLNTENHGFTLVLSADYVKANTEKTVLVNYNATINSSAKINATDKNTNTAELKYSNQTSTKTTNVYTYDFNISKVDGSNNRSPLSGAGFKLYDEKDNQIKVNHDGTGYYVDDTADAKTEIMVDENGKANVRGLKPGKYYLEETTTPAGYNTLVGKKEVVITSKGTATVPVEVINNQGSELPSTGGIGTTIFYVIGAILVLGAGVLLVARKRTAAK